MKHIALDTNIFRGNPTFDSLGFRALTRLCKNDVYRLHIPYIVEREFQTQQLADFEKESKKALSGISSLRRKPISKGLRETLEDIEVGQARQDVRGTSGSPFMNFDLRSTSEFSCPYCAKSKLSPKRESGNKLAMLNALSPEHRKYHETSSEYDELEIHTFALELECTNPDCRMTTIVVGRIDAYPDYSGTYREYDTTVSPRYFYPPVDILPVPDHIPEAVRSELRRSYALYFSDPKSSANPLRSAIECFMDAAGVTAKSTSGRELTLHQRLVEFKKASPDVADLLGAIKWLGNDGSHYGQGVTANDIKAAYEVFLHAMAKHFDDPDKRAKANASQISKGRTL